MIGRAARIGLLLAAAPLLNGCGALSCADSDPILEKVKKLDHEYLSQLYEYAASGQCKFTCSPPLLNRLSGLGNRAPVFEVVPHRQAQIKLSVCMDEGVILIFRAIGTPDAAITVISSHDGVTWNEAVLWSNSQSNHDVR